MIRVRQSRQCEQQRVPGSRVLNSARHRPLHSDPDNRCRDPIKRRPCVPTGFAGAPAFLRERSQDTEAHASFSGILIRSLIRDVTGDVVLIWNHIKLPFHMRVRRPMSATRSDSARKDASCRGFKYTGRLPTLLYDHQIDLLRSFGADE